MELLDKVGEDGGWEDGRGGRQKGVCCDWKDGGLVDTKIRLDQGFSMRGAVHDASTRGFSRFRVFRVFHGAE
jgi:hypothetical protein